MAQRVPIPIVCRTVGRPSVMTAREAGDPHIEDGSKRKVEWSSECPSRYRISLDNARFARRATPLGGGYGNAVERERELVAKLASKDTVLVAMREFVGGVTATELNACELSDAAFSALSEGLSHANPRVRWWCIQIFDHADDDRAMRALAGCLDDPIARVRRNAVHALTCDKCKPAASAWSTHRRWRGSPKSRNMIPAQRFGLKPGTGLPA